LILRAKYVVCRTCSLTVVVEPKTIKDLEVNVTYANYLLPGPQTGVCDAATFS